MTQSATSNSRSKGSDQDLFQVPLLLRFVFPVVMLSCAACFVPFDLSIAHYFRHGDYPSFIRKLVENTEPFGHAIGVIFILATMAAANRRQAREFLHVGFISLGAGLCTDLIKFSIGRVRPRDLDLLTITDYRETFEGWYPYFRGLDMNVSFPSGHTTVAFAFAVCLSVLFPRAKWMFFLLAFIVGFGRVQSSAHFPSDVCAGAAMGWSVAMLVIFYFEWTDLSANYYRKHGDSAGSPFHTVETPSNPPDAT